MCIFGSLFEGEFSCVAGFVDNHPRRGIDCGCIHNVLTADEGRSVAGILTGLGKSFKTD
jgi:hypothetical protein